MSILNRLNIKDRMQKIEKASSILPTREEVAKASRDDDNPDYGVSEGTFDVAVTFMEKKEFKSAFQYLKECIRSNFKFAPAYLMLADIYQKEEMRYDARLILLKGIEYSGSFLCYDKLAEVYRAQGLDDKVPELWNQYVACSLKKELGYIRLAEYYYSEGNPEQAAYNYRAANRMKPDDVEVLNSLADVLREMGQDREALSLYIEFNDSEHSKVWSRNKTNRAWLLNRIGDIYYDLKEYKNAFEWYTNTLEVETHNANAFGKLGDMLFMDGDLNEAETRYRIAVNIEPQNIELLARLSTLLVFMGRHDRVSQVYKEMLRINPVMNHIHQALLRYESEGVFDMETAYTVLEENCPFHPEKSKVEGAGRIFPDGMPGISGEAVKEILEQGEEMGGILSPMESEGEAMENDDLDDTALPLMKPMEKAPLKDDLEDTPLPPMKPVEKAPLKDEIEDTPLPPMKPVEKAPLNDEIEDTPLPPIKPAEKASEETESDVSYAAENVSSLNTKDVAANSDLHKDFQLPPLNKVEKKTDSDIKKVADLPPLPPLFKETDFSDRPTVVAETSKDNFKKVNDKKDAGNSGGLRQQRPSATEYMPKAGDFGPDSYKTPSETVNENKDSNALDDNTLKNENLELSDTVIQAFETIRQSLDSLRLTASEGDLSEDYFADAEEAVDKAEKLVKRLNHAISESRTKWPHLHDCRKNKSGEDDIFGELAADVEAKKAFVEYIKFILDKLESFRFVQPLAELSEYYRDLITSEKLKGDSYDALEAAMKKKTAYEIGKAFEALQDLSTQLRPGAEVIVEKLRISAGL